MGPLGPGAGMPAPVADCRAVQPRYGQGERIAQAHPHLEHQILATVGGGELVEAVDQSGGVVEHRALPGQQEAGGGEGLGQAEEEAARDGRVAHRLDDLDALIGHELADLEADAGDRVDIGAPRLLDVERTAGPADAGGGSGRRLLDRGIGAEVDLHHVGDGLIALGRAIELELAVVHLEGVVLLHERVAGVVARGRPIQVVVVGGVDEAGEGGHVGRDGRPVAGGGDHVPGTFLAGGGDEEGRDWQLRICGMQQSPGPKTRHDHRFQNTELLVRHDGDHPMVNGLWVSGA